MKLKTYQNHYNIGGDILNEGTSESGSIVGDQEGCSCVILVLRECIWNTPTFSLALPAFDDTVSLGFLSRRVIYPLVPPWVTASSFLAGNREAELKLTAFYSLLLFLSFLFS